MCWHCLSRRKEKWRIHANQATLQPVDTVYPDKKRLGEYTPVRPRYEVLTLSIQTQREMDNTRQSGHVTTCWQCLSRQKEKWRIHANQAMLGLVDIVYPDKKRNGEYTSIRPCYDVLILPVQTEREMENTRQSGHVTKCWHRLSRRKETWKIQANQAMLGRVDIVYPHRRRNGDTRQSGHRKIGRTNSCQWSHVWRFDVSSSRHRQMWKIHSSQTAKKSCWPLLI